MSNEQVCIIRAGLAGLSAALYLAGRNIRVTLIEKEDRSGGLASSVPIGDEAWATIIPNVGTPVWDMSRRRPMSISCVHRCDEKGDGEPQ